MGARGYTCEGWAAVNAGLAFLYLKKILQPAKPSGS